MGQYIMGEIGAIGRFGFDGVSEGDRERQVTHERIINPRKMSRLKGTFGKEGRMRAVMRQDYKYKENRLKNLFII